MANSHPNVIRLKPKVEDYRGASAGLLETAREHLSTMIALLHAEPRLRSLLQGSC
jgi:hypothetical protein